MDSTKDKELNRFREIFWDAFNVPELESEKFTKKFQDMEQLNDLIAGPLFSVYENGHCDFVFSEERFKGINTPDSFFEWMVETVKEYAERLVALEPENEKEEKDLQTLLFQADLKMELAEIAHNILKKKGQ